MTTRYVTSTQEPTAAWWEVRGADYLAKTVHEIEPAKIDTGLLNAEGLKLYRVDAPNPIGFVRQSE